MGCLYIPFLESCLSDVDATKRGGEHTESYIPLSVCPIQPHSICLIYWCREVEVKMWKRGRYGTEEWW